VIPTIAIKLKQVQKEEVMQKNVELNGIPKLMHEYTNKYSNYIYYHWVQQSSILKSSSHSNNAIGHKFPILPTQCTLRYIPILGTSKQTNVTLVWKNFVAFCEPVILVRRWKVMSLSTILI
jgi:hypothetical protein